MLDMIISIWLSSDATFILGFIVVGATIKHYGSATHAYITERVKDKSK